jgi:hypothetical protein
MPKAICSIEGCQKPKKSRGWCEMHYTRWRTHGDPLVSKVIMGDDAARFWSKVDKDGPLPQPGSLADDRGLGQCWLWTPPPDTHGYGQFRVDGRLTGAHLYSFALHGGVLVAELEIDHLCRRPICVNPGHFEQVTPRVNLMRSQSWAALNAAKTHCPQGHPYDAENTYRPARGGRMCRKCGQTQQTERTPW